MTALVRARSALMLAVLLMCASDGFAQQLSLSGTVRDTTGVVPGATVTLVQSGSAEQSTMTDQSGAYSFTGLAAGSVELTFAMRGFETVVRNISLGPNTPPVDVALAVGRVTTAVTVEAAAGKATATRFPWPIRTCPRRSAPFPRNSSGSRG